MLRVLGHQKQRPVTHTSAEFGWDTAITGGLQSDVVPLFGTMVSIPSRCTVTKSSAAVEVHFHSFILLPLVNHI